MEEREMYLFLSSIYRITQEDIISLKNEFEKLINLMYLEKDKILKNKKINLKLSRNIVKYRSPERIEKIKASNPDKKDDPIPVDLVTSSGSGLDPHISVAAAEYQVERISKARNISTDEVEQIIEKYTKGRALGVFGEETVNVLQVNLALDGKL